MKKFFGFLKSLFKKGGVSGGGVPIQAPVVEKPVGSLPENEEPLWISEARKGLGQKEVYGNLDNQYIVELYEDVVGVKYHDETAWCMAFVMAILKRTGYKYLKSLWAADAENYGVACDLKPYCIATKFSKAANSKRHVFFVLSVNEKKGTVTALGGNQKNMVCIEEFLISDIRSTRWPVE